MHRSIAFTPVGNGGGKPVRRNAGIHGQHDADVGNFSADGEMARFSRSFHRCRAYLQTGRVSIR